MKQPHHHRQSAVVKNGREALKAKPAKEYRDGFFTEPVRAWSQMQFESQLCKQIDTNTKRFKSDFQRAAEHRKSSGFNRHPLGLPGASPYTPYA